VLDVPERPRRIASTAAWHELRVQDMAFLGMVGVTVGAVLSPRGCRVARGLVPAAVTIDATRLFAYSPGAYRPPRKNRERSLP
jgi:hypothetical protein